MRKILILAMNASLIAATATISAAMAETKAPAAAPTPAPAPPVPAPQTFGDWTLRCGASPDGTMRACEIDSWITPEGQKQPIAQIAFGRPSKTAAKADADKAPDKSKDKPAAPGKDAAADKTAPAADKPLAAATDAGTTRLVVLVPVNVTIAPGIDFIADAAKPHMNIPLKTCIPAACLGQIELTDAQMQAFRNLPAPGQLTFTDPGGRPVTVAVSFKGLDQALDSLAKQ